MKKFFVLLVAMTIMAGAVNVTTVQPSSAGMNCHVTLAQVGEQHTRPVHDFRRSHFLQKFFNRVGDSAVWRTVC
jgi:hypothetical protein